MVNKDNSVIKRGRKRPKGRKNYENRPKILDGVKVLNSSTKWGGNSERSLGSNILPRQEQECLHEVEITCLVSEKLGIHFANSKDDVVQTVTALKKEELGMAISWSLSRVLIFV